MIPFLQDPDVTPAKQALERLGQAIDAACSIENDWWDAEYADVHTALALVAAELNRGEQLEAALREAHERICGCDQPGRSDMCIAGPEFAALSAQEPGSCGTRNRMSTPKLDLRDRRSRIQKLWDRLPWSKYGRLVRNWKRKYAPASRSSGEVEPSDEKKES
jgi:hypothetical protein